MIEHAEAKVSELMDGFDEKNECLMLLWGLYWACGSADYAMQMVSAKMVRIFNAPCEFTAEDIAAFEADYE